MSKHRLLVIPGLGDDKALQTRLLEHALSGWQKHAVYPEIYLMRWHDTKKTFEQKLTGLLAKIDTYSDAKETVSLMGMSAGASAALNAFILRRTTVYKCISASGRLRGGSYTDFRSLDQRSATSPAFKESVLQFEKSEPLLKPAERKRILTVRARFGDELVPGDTATIPGAHNIQIPTAEHLLTGALTVSLFSKLVIDFLA
jgi:hypothetical protein